MRRWNKYVGQNTAAARKGIAITASVQLAPLPTKRNDDDTHTSNCEGVHAGPIGERPHHRPDIGKVALAPLLLNSAPNSAWAFPDVESGTGIGAGEVALREGVTRARVCVASTDPGTAQKYGAAYGSVRAVFCLFFSCGL